MSLRTRLILSFFGVVGLTLALSFALTYQKTREFFEEQLQTKLHDHFRDELRLSLKNLASVISLSVDGSLVQDIQSQADEQREDYLEQRQRLIQIKQMLPQIRFLYVYRPREEPGQVQMIVGGEAMDDPPEDVTHFAPYEAAEYPQMLQGFVLPTADEDLTRDEFGVWLSGYAPVRDAQGNKVAAVGLDLPANRVEQKEKEIADIVALTQKSLLQRLAFSTLIALLVALLVGYGVARLVSRPLLKLVDATGQIAGGDLESQVDIERSDEIGQLARSFNRMVRNLGDMASALQQFATDAVASKELEIAARLQKSLVPVQALEAESVSITSELQPAAFGGGWAYDYFFFGQNSYLMFAAFQSDEIGLEALAALTICKSSLSSEVSNVVFRPQTLAERLSKTLWESQLGKKVEERSSVAFFCGVYDLQAGWLTIVNAGHEFPFLLRVSNESPLQLDHIGGPALGSEESPTYQDIDLQINPGDRLVLFSPGLPHIQNVEGQEFGMEALESFLLTHQESESLDLKNALLAKVDAFRGEDVPLSQDEGVVVLEFSPPNQEDSAHG